MELLHLFKDYRTCPENEKPCLIEIFKAEKAAKYTSIAQAVGRLEGPHSSSDKNDSSIRFFKNFAGSSTDTVFADIGSDMNLIDTSSISKIQATAAEIQIEHLAKPATYSLAVNKVDRVGTIKIVCIAHVYYDG